MKEVFFPAIEEELHYQISKLKVDHASTFHEMLSYHMGWIGDGAGKDAQGKRIRPLMVLLTCWGCGGDWKKALPASAAVELVHNFSLVHDDIQDRSELRRGRLTLWKKWGIPQAINAGDALFVLSNLALMDLNHEFAPGMVVKTVQVLQETCLDLTRGQFLDIAYENSQALEIEEYWTMIAGKTAALLSACCAVGALLGGANEQTQSLYANFGHDLGLAFQVQDDILGIWGNTAITGKSSFSDLVSGKKTLPILIGMKKKGIFAKQMQAGPISPGEVPNIISLMDEEGIQVESEAYLDKLTKKALQSLNQACPSGEAKTDLFDLAHQLIQRNS